MIGFSAVERYSFFDGLYYADFYGPFAMRFMVKGPFSSPLRNNWRNDGQKFYIRLTVVRGALNCA
ncbi:MAG: hypothetical protein V8R75_12960 [Oscillospiraceae bacterium]